MKANRRLNGILGLTLALSICVVAVAGCSNNNPNVPKTVEEQTKDVRGVGPIPPDILAKMRAQYGQGGSYDQKVQGAQGAAGAAKQAASGQAPAQPKQAPALH